LTRTLRFVLTTLSLVTISCANDPATTQLVIPLVTITPVLSDGGNSSGITASGVVVPVHVSELSFSLSGPVKDVSVFTGETVEIGQTLIVLHVPELEYGVIAADAALRSAQSYANLQRFRRTIVNQKGKTLYLTGPHEVLEVADARVAVAQAGLEKAMAEIQQTSLAAPFDGTVVAMNATVGQFIPSGQVVLTLADLAEFEIETTDLNERDVPSVRLGQDVTVYVEALELDLPGKVSRISPLAEINDGDVVYKAIIQLTDQPAELRWGMKVSVKFE